MLKNGFPKDILDKKWYFVNFVQGHPGQMLDIFLHFYNDFLTLTHAKIWIYQNIIDNFFFDFAKPRTNAKKS